MPRFLLWLLCVGLLLPGVALTVVRLVEPDLARTTQLQAFTPLGLPLYAAALLLLLLLALRRATRHRLLVVPIAVAVAGLALHAVWFAPLVSGSVPRSATDAPTTGVMTANLLAGAGDATRLVVEASEAGTDVLVVSEVTRGDVAEMEGVGLSDVFPHRLGQAEAADGFVGATMVFSREPIELVETLDTTFDGMLVRTGDLTFLAVHPAPPTLYADWKADHRAILEVAEREGVDVIAGDLNATLDHAPLRALVDAGYRDAAEITNAGLAATWPVDGGFPLLSLLPPSVAIDHVLVSEARTVTRTRTVDVPGSDHRAVLATVAPR
ncbi:endonuclease/exonuclease/phosphatase family protein [Nocardioides sp.]|uniref:endonuclease/exonuclease/phosphatase family protein n=1 Tax=Nocardioides sp. TaxID=35761 RepID=UPI00286A81BD|nr:endonuclease/exonuclease/phosphatase family protein [Nocardioides sp.]